MKIGIPVWTDRVSPVFDVASTLLLVDVENGQEISRQTLTLGPADAVSRARQVMDMGVNVLICGAISQPLEMILSRANITIIPFMCGGAEDILASVVANQVPDARFQMPGCCGQRRRFGGGRGQGSGQGRGRGAGMGRGRGQGRSDPMM